MSLKSDSETNTSVSLEEEVREINSFGKHKLRLVKCKSLPEDDCGKLFWSLTWRLKLVWSVSEAFGALRKSVCCGRALRGMWSLLMINLKVGNEIWLTWWDAHTRVTLWIKFKQANVSVGVLLKLLGFFFLLLRFSFLILIVSLKTRKQWRTEERGSAREKKPSLLVL